MSKSKEPVRIPVTIANTVWYVNCPCGMTCIRTTRKIMACMGCNRKWKLEVKAKAVEVKDGSST